MLGLVPKKRKFNQCDGTECWTVSGHYCCEGIYDGFCCGKSYTCSDQQTDDCPHKGFSLMNLIQMNCFGDNSYWPSNL